MTVIHTCCSIYIIIIRHLLHCVYVGTVYGDPLPRKQEDNMKLVIDEIFKKFRPMVPPQRYRVTCTHLGGRYHGSDQRVVVEIRVQAGVDFEMYEDYNHEVGVAEGVVSASGDAFIGHVSSFKWNLEM